MASDESQAATEPLKKRLRSVTTKKKQQGKVTGQEDSQDAEWAGKKKTGVADGKHASKKNRVLAGCSTEAVVGRKKVNRADVAAEGEQATRKSQKKVNRADGATEGKQVTRKMPKKAIRGKVDEQATRKQQNIRHAEPGTCKTPTQAKKRKRKLDSLQETEQVQAATTAPSKTPAAAPPAAAPPEVDLPPRKRKTLGRLWTCPYPTCDQVVDGTPPGWRGARQREENADMDVSEEASGEEYAVTVNETRTETDESQESEEHRAETEDDSPTEESEEDHRDKEDTTWTPPPEAVPKKRTTPSRTVPEEVPARVALKKEAALKKEVVVQEKRKPGKRPAAVSTVRKVQVGKQPGFDPPQSAVLKIAARRQLKGRPSTTKKKKEPLPVQERPGRIDAEIHAEIDEGETHATSAPIASKLAHPAQPQTVPALFAQPIDKTPSPQISGVQIEDSGTKFDMPQNAHSGPVGHAHLNDKTTPSPQRANVRIEGGSVKFDRMFDGPFQPTARSSPFQPVRRRALAPVRQTADDNTTRNAADTHGQTAALPRAASVDTVAHFPDGFRPRTDVSNEGRRHGGGVNGMRQAHLPPGEAAVHSDTELFPNQLRPRQHSAQAEQHHRRFNGRQHAHPPARAAPVLDDAERFPQRYGLQPTAATHDGHQLRTDVAGRNFDGLQSLIAVPVNAALRLPDNQPNATTAATVNANLRDANGHVGHHVHPSRAAVDHRQPRAFAEPAVLHNPSPPNAGLAAQAQHLSPGLQTALLAVGVANLTAPLARGLSLWHTGQNAVCTLSSAPERETLVAALATEAGRPASPGHPRALILTARRDTATQCATAARNLLVRALPGCGSSETVALLIGQSGVSAQVRGVRMARIVVGTVSRVWGLLEQGEIDCSGVRLLVLENAHDVSGKPELVKVVAKMPAGGQTLAFSGAYTSATTNNLKRVMGRARFVHLDRDAREQMTSLVNGGAGRPRDAVRNVAAPPQTGADAFGGGTMQGLTVPAEEANWAAAGDAIVTAPHRNGRDTTIAQIVARFVRESGRMQQLVAVVVVPTRAMATSMKVLLEFALSERVAVLVGGSGNKNGESLRGTRVAVVTMTKFAMLADDGRIRTDEVGMLVLVEANELVVKATSGGAPWTLESFWMLFPALQRRLAFSEFYAGSSVAKLRQLMDRPRLETLRLDG